MLSSKISNSFFGLNMRLPNRSYSAGLAMSIPFYADLISKKYALVLLIPLIFSFFGSEKRKIYFDGLGLLIAIFLSIAVFHVFSLVFSYTQYWLLILKEIFFLFYLILIYSLCLPSRRSEAERGFFDAVILLAFFSALIGLVKFFMQERGFLLGFIVADCPDIYPQGTNLCADYNLVGMMYLVASVGLLRKLLSNFSWKLVIVLSLILASGVLLGSRRFLVLVFFLPVYWFIGLYYKNEIKYKIKRNLSFVFFVLAFVSCVVSLVPDEQMSGGFKLGRDSYTVISLENIFSDDMRDISSENQASFSGRYPNSTSPGSILGTMNLDSVYGLDSRLGRWEYALRIAGDNYYMPTGFNYHNLFSCDGRGKCNGFNYPHSSILSALLIGGFPLAIVVISLYFLLLRRVFVIGGAGWMSGVPMVVLIVLPYSLISGDTVFSLAHLIAVSLMLFGHVDE